MPKGGESTRGAGGGSLLGRAAVAVRSLFTGRGLLTLTRLDEFERIVLAADQPVLIEFYKPGCPTCLPLEPTLVRLARRYAGRATVARFRLMSPLFVHTSWRLSRRYGLYFVPTVLLFVGGHERRRWFMEYRSRAYRAALDEALAAAVPASGPIAL